MCDQQHYDIVPQQRKLIFGVFSPDRLRCVPLRVAGAGSRARFRKVPESAGTGSGGRFRRVPACLRRLCRFESQVRGGTLIQQNQLRTI